MNAINSIVQSSKFKVQSCLRGFTLIELLVVMTILGLLSTVGLVSFRTSQMKSRDAQRKSDLGQIQRALEIYYNDYGTYPTSTDGKIDVGGALNWGDEFKDAKGTVYMKELPKDPTGNPEYCYMNFTSPVSYKLYAKLENSKDPKILVSAQTCNAVSYNYGVASPNVRLEEGGEPGPTSPPVIPTSPPAPQPTQTPAPTSPPAIPTPTPATPTSPPVGTPCTNDSECGPINPNCYLDADGDRYAATSGGKTCRAFPSLGTDCYDSNANARPGQTAYFVANRGDGSYDYNCDGVETKLYQTFPESSLSCTTTKPTQTIYQGWTEGSVPPCGVQGWYQFCFHYEYADCSGGGGGYSSCVWGDGYPAYGAFEIAVTQQLCR